MTEINKSKKSKHVRVFWVQRNALLQRHSYWLAMCVESTRSICEYVRDQGCVVDEADVFGRIYTHIQIVQFPAVVDICLVHVGGSSDSCAFVVELTFDYALSSVVNTIRTIHENPDAGIPVVTRDSRLYHISFIPKTDDTSKFRRAVRGLKRIFRPYAAPDQPVIIPDSYESVQWVAAQEQKAELDSAKTEAVRVSEDPSDDENLDENAIDELLTDDSGTTIASDVLLTALLLDLFELGALKSGTFLSSLEKARNLLGSDGVPAIDGPDLDKFVESLLRTTHTVKKG